MRAPSFSVQSLPAGNRGISFCSEQTGSLWKPSQQTRPLKEACTAAKISPAIGFHVLRHTHASLLAMKGVPMGVIAAQLGHADTRITEKHYAHLSPSYVADTIRAAFRLWASAARRTFVHCRRGDKFGCAGIGRRPEHRNWKPASSKSALQL